MRGIKRVLSIILAAAVMLSVIVVPSVAAASEYPKIDCQAVGATTEASDQGSDSSSNSNAVIDNVSNNTTGAFKWYVAGNKLTGANLTIILPKKYKIDKITLISGYPSRDPATVNTEDNKSSHQTAEIPFKYQFEYANEGGAFELIPNTKVEKTFDGLTSADHNVTFEFDEVETDKIKFTALEGNYDFRILEIELYGVEAGGDPAPKVENVALGRPATVSAKANGTPEALTDGVTNQTTGDYVWVASAAQASAGAYADIDLGLANISSMVLYHGMNSGSDRLTDFEVQYLGKTGDEYQTLKTETGVSENPYTVTFGETVCATHIRIVSKCTTMFRIREIEVMGTKLEVEDETKDPEISVTPVTGASAGTDVTLSADVTANENSIDKVEFYNGAELLGEGSENGGKYEYTLKKAAGSYNITARLTYNTDKTLVSAPMIFTAEFDDLGTNVAAGKTATASYYSSANGGPEVLLDGTKNQTTGKNVVFVDQNKTNGVYFDIDLGGLCDVDKVVLYHGMSTPRTQTLQSFEVQYSGKTDAVGDGDYTTLKTVTGATENPWTIALDEAVRAGHIRLVSKMENSSTNMFRILEIEVYGKEVIPPAVTVDEIDNITAGESVTLKAAVTDNGNTINKVEFYDNDTLLGEGTMNVDKYEYTFANAEEGSHSITAVVTYDTDKTVTSEAVTFAVQAPPEPDAPVIVVDDISDISEGDSVTLSATLTDNGNVIEKVEFFDNITELIGTAVSSSDGKYTYEWEAPSAGTHKITATVTYGESKTVISEAVNFTVRAKPTVAADPIENVIAGDSVTLKAAVTDNGNAIDKVEFFDNSDLLGAGELNGDKYEYTMPDVSEGAHSITATVTYDTDKTVTSEAVEFTALPKPIEPTGTNIALGAAVTSSEKDSGNSSGASLTDGVTDKTSGTDKWFVGKAKTLDAWADLKLLKHGKINAVKVYSGYNDINTSSKDKLTDFEVWYSDVKDADPTSLADYKLAETVTGAPLGLVTVSLSEEVDAWHVKIVSKVANNRVDAQGSDGIRIREIEVYGTEIIDSQVSDPEITLDPVGSVTAGDSVVLSAVVNDNGNTIDKVEFFDSGVLLGAGELSAGKYKYTMPAVAEGSHSITATVTYDTDKTVTSEAVEFTALPKPIEPTGTNIALGAAVTSSEKDSGNSSGASLTDGVTDKTSGTDKWFVGKAKTLDAWADLKLLKHGKINAVKVYSGYNDINTSSKDKLTDFEVWYSDVKDADPTSLADYKLAETVTGAPLGLVTVSLSEEVDAWHVKIVSKVANNRVDAQGSDGIRIREIEVYGTEIIDSQVSDPEITLDPVGSVTAGDSVVLSAVVNDNGNTIDKVEFFDSGVLLGAGELSGGKYEYTMPAVAEGSHSITATVTYNTDKTVTSAPVKFTAEPNSDALFEITIESPTESEELKPNEKFTIKATVTDAKKMLSRVNIYINERTIAGFEPSADGIYSTEAIAEPGVNSIIAEAVASDGTVQKKSIVKTIDYPKVEYDNTFVATASKNGSDSSSNPSAVIDNKTNSDIGSNKWYINADSAPGSYLTISFPDNYRLNGITLYSGYIGRDPAEANIESNKPNNTAEVPFLYQFEYEKADGSFELIPGTKVEKSFGGLTEDDKIVSFSFDEIETSKIKFVSLPGNYAYRLLEIETFGYVPNSAPSIVLDELPNDGMVMEDADITLTAAIEDKEDEIRSVTLYIDGAPSDTVFEQTEQNANKYTATLKGGSLSVGKHTLMIKATDGFMSEGESNVITVSVSSEKDILDVLNGSTRANIAENFEFAAAQLKTDLRAFNALSKSNKEKVYLALLKKNFTSAAELQSFLNSTIRGLSSSSTSPSGGGTSSGGGGGSAPAGGGIVKPSGGSTSQPPQSTGTDESKAVFSDLQEVNWAEEAITALSEQGVINGVGDGKFAPLEHVTRGQFAKILIGALGLISDGAKADFTDVSETDEFYPYIASAQQLSIINGMGDGTFGVNNEITREDLGVMMVRAADAAGIELPSEKEETAFSDSDEIAQYAVDAVIRLQRAGIMNGMGDGSFAPLESANRAMAAKVIYELMNLK